MRRLWMTPVAALLLLGSLASAQTTPPIIASGLAEATQRFRLPFNPVTPAMASIPLVAKVPTPPLTGLADAKLFPDLCVYRYRAGTVSSEAQQFIDQGLGFYYSYVWMEAARSFEMATRHDPECAFAWWGLSRSLDKWNKRDAATKAAERAQELQPLASDREQRLITALLQEKGLISSIKEEDRVKEAAKTLDELLTLYSDDQEGWFYRAQLASKLGGGTSAVPYYQALLLINPLHPGANHELVHFYENWKRPALGWPHAERYMESSPGIPHAFHMQAHLAMRIGKWEHTTDHSARAIELEQAYHEYQGVQPRQDHQYSHHLEILTISLVHDGRFQEARAIQAEARRVGYKHWDVWFRLHRGERDWDAYTALLDEYRKAQSSSATYYAALMHLDRGEVSLAEAEMLALEEFKNKRDRDQTLKQRYNEVHGRYLCLTGSPTEGLALLKETVDTSVDDFKQHSWGNGAYYMEAWGLAALQAGDLVQAEEAFLESLAHDNGSVRGAVGMQILCGEMGRTQEAERFALVAQRCWAKADAGRLEALREELAGLAEGIGSGTVTSTPE